MKKMRNWSLILISLALIVSSCAETQKEKETVEEKEYIPVVITPERVTRITLNDSISKALLKRGRIIAANAKVALKKELKAALAKGGFDHAVTFCKTRAMEITDSISLAEQVYVERLAKKNRNPLNETINDDSTVFKSYIVNWLSGARVQSMVSWDNRGRPVYYNPIMTESMCLNCHGIPGQDINPELAEKIAQLYPDDKATGFKFKDIRGMWKITFPEYMVIDVEMQGKPIDSN